MQTSASASFQHRPSPLTGAIFGALFMLPVAIIMGLGYTVAGFTVLPLRLFDWLARYLPAELVNFGKDLIGSLAGQFRIIEGSTSSTAKLAEQIMGYGFILLIGLIAGGLFFFLMNRIRARQPQITNDIIPGLVLGIIVALPLLLMDSAVGQTGGTGGLPTTLWNISLLILWGAALTFLYGGLVVRSQGRLAAQEAAASRAAAVDAEARAYSLNRRQFLVQMGGATAAITVLGGGVAALLSQNLGAGETVVGGAEATLSPEAADEIASLPNAVQNIQVVPGTRPEITPLQDHYRIDISTLPPTIAEEGYTLPFTTRLNEDGTTGGNTRTVSELTLDEVRAMEATDVYLTMACISNPVGGDLISTTKWTGVSMQAILERVGVPAGATHLKITGADTFDETVAIDLINDDERIMLAYAWDDQPLLPKHGFPLRIHIPDLFGMKQPKWIRGIEFLGADEDGYWVRRGWDKVARVLATSVIDTVAVDEVYEQDGQMFVPIGGMAWAGARGVSGVQVRVDEGEWMDAQVREPINERTWSLWRYDWPFQEGRHTFTVRMIEGDGSGQIETPARNFPAGATGYHQASADVRAPIMQPTAEATPVL